MAKHPFTSRRAPLYQDVPDEKWNDWRWQLSHRLNTVEDFEKVLPLTDSERKALSTSGLFRVDITPYFVSLIDPDDPDDPIRKQVIPPADEIVPFTGMMEDSLAEDRHSPVPGLVHRYPDRVLMLVTTQCASYCRYCTRSRIVGDPTATFSRAEFEMQIEYLKRTPQVRDVLLSGGDPLTLAPKLLEELLGRLREIPHIEIIRIGTPRAGLHAHARHRTSCATCCRSIHPLWMNIHVNHPNEITPSWPRPATGCPAPASRWATSRCCWPASTTACTSSASWCRTWCASACARTTSTSATWWKAPGISARRLARASRSSKACAGIPPAMPCPPTWSMPPAAAARSR